jgi:hypothetical protein
MNEKRWFGNWWVSDEPLTIRPGVLIVGLTGEARLELIGGFNVSIHSTDDEGNSTIAAGERTLSMIHGECEGVDVTLVRCFVLDARGGWFGEEPQFQRLYASRVLQGIHLDNLKSAVFKGAVLQIENFTSWLKYGNDSISRKGREKGRDSAEIHPAAIEPAYVDGWKLEAQNRSSGFVVDETRVSLTVRGTVGGCIEVTPPASCPIGDFDALALEMSDLMTLATGTGCGLIHMTLIYNEDRTIPMRGQPDASEKVLVSVYGERVHRAAPDEPATRYTRCRFTTADLSFKDAIEGWLPLRRKTQAACNMYFGGFYAAHAFAENRLLANAIAAEALHQALYGDATDFPDEEFRDLRARILNELPDSNEKRWVKANLRNSPSYRVRLGQLAASPPRDAVDLVVRDVDSWTRQLKEARNDLAHNAGANGASNALHDLVQMTSGLLTLVWMQRLGVPESAQLRAAENLLRADM